MQRNSYGVKAALFDEMDVRLSDVVFTIAVPEVMGTLRPDEFGNERLNLARRLRATLIQMPHITFGNQSVTQVCPA